MGRNFDHFVTFICCSTRITINHRLRASSFLRLEQVGSRFRQRWISFGVIRNSNESSLAAGKLNQSYVVTIIESKCRISFACVTDRERRLKQD